MNPSTRRIDRILADAPLAAALLARLAAGRQAAQAIAVVCAEVAPDFDPLRPGTCDLRGGILRIWLRSSAHSAKLRQAMPRLLAVLRSSGLEVSEIKVGVQLGSVREKSPPKNGNTGPERDPGFQSTHLATAEMSLQTTAEAHSHLQRIREFSSKLALTLKDSELRRALVRLDRSVEAKLTRIR